MPARNAGSLAPSVLPPGARTKLIGILGRLDSPFDGERAAAALLAGRLVRNAGTSWDALIPSDDERSVEPPLDRPTPDSRRPIEVLRDLDLLRRHQATLTPWLQSFVWGCLAQPTPLSERQREKLRQAAAECRLRGFA